MLLPALLHHQEQQQEVERCLQICLLSHLCHMVLSH
jgi:hypothetical protein